MKNRQIHLPNNIVEALSAESSRIFDLADVILFESEEVCSTVHSPHLVDLLNSSNSDADKIFVLLNYCFDNYIFASRWLLGVDLLPFQAAIIDSFWKHRFSFLLGTRGAGKCVAPDTLVMTNKGFMHINSVRCPIKFYGDNNLFNDVDYIWNRDNEILKGVITSLGYEIVGTKDHPILCFDGGKTYWKQLKDVRQGDTVVLCKSKRWFNGKSLTDYEISWIVKGLLEYNILEREIYIADIKSIEIIAEALKNKKIELTWEKHAKDLQSILLAAGFICKRNKNVITNVHRDTLFKEYYFDKVKEVYEALDISLDVFVPDGHTFWSNGFISHNSFLFALYACLRAILIQGSRVVIVSGSFRQSKAVFEYIADFWDRWNIFRQIAPNGPKRGVDMCTLKIGRSSIYAVPLGGDTIRGLRSNVTLCDEIAYIPEDILKTVIMGFSAVSMSPNERVKQFAKKNKGYDIGKDNIILSNQILFAGTASFAFNHSKKWYDLYRDIVRSKGDFSKIGSSYENLLTDEEILKFNYKDFSVITLPYNKLPPGFLDETIIMNAKMNLPPELFDMEYNAKYVDDTQGFIPMSLIVSKTRGSVKISSEGPCVMGIDPARSSANFAIVIIDLSEDIPTIVYCWSFNENRLRQEFVIEDEVSHLGYYPLGVAKIFHLIERFNVKCIVLDKGGGGDTVADILRDPTGYSIPDKIAPYNILPIEIGMIDDEHNKSILMLKKFTNEIIVEANYSFKRDIQSNKLAFADQFLDTALQIGKVQFLHDSYDYINKEIELMKKEISIVKAIKSGNTVRFDTGTGGHKPHKDRYSAALMAYMASRYFLNEDKEDILVEEYDVSADLVKHR